MSSFVIEDVETSKFPRSSRFFSRNTDLPDLRAYQLLINGNPMAFNGQQTNINYNPFTFPQSKTKANIPLDFFHLPNRIHLTDVPRDTSDSTQTSQAPPNEIPVFKLDESQSKDPIQFVESVREVGEQFGAVKLRLPDYEDSLIRSNFQVNSDLFWFETNKLLNNPPRDELASRLKFHAELIKFHMNGTDKTPVVATTPLSAPKPVSGTAQNQSEVLSKVENKNPRITFNSISNLLNSPSPVLVEEKVVVKTEDPPIEVKHDLKTESTEDPEEKKKKKAIPPFLLKAPSIDKRTLDLYKLFRSVIIRGGFSEVINKKLWAQIGRELGYKGKIMTSLSSSLKSSYIRILHAFEIYLGPKSLALLGIAKKEETSTAVETNGNGKRLLEPELENELDQQASKFRKVELNTPPLVIGSSAEFRRSIKSKSAKGILLNSPNLIDFKQPNTFTVKVPQSLNQIQPQAQPFQQAILHQDSDEFADIDQKKKGKKSLDISAMSIQPQNQLNHALIAMINNQDSYQDKSSSKSIPKLASIYSMRQFMEKDLKFQEFIVKHNHEVFNKLNVPAAITTIPTAAPIPFSTSPSNGSQSSNFFNFNDSNMPIPERNFTKVDSYEALYWKFVQNDQVHEYLNDGIEFENGDNIPNLINGSGFVKIGDDLINYKNNLNNLSINASNGKFQSSNNKPLHGFVPGTASGSVPNLISHFHLHSNSPCMQSHTSASTASSSSSSNQVEVTHFNSPEYISNMLEASLSPWNLHNLPVLPNSLLGAFQENDLNNQDLMNSRINIGMTFSTSNWKCEDHFTQLMNFHFFGSFKKWYFIPESEFEKFENLIKEVNLQNQSRTSINNPNVDSSIDEILKVLNIDEINEVDTEILLSSLDNMIYPCKDIRLRHSNAKFQELIDLSQKQRLMLNQDFVITPELLKEHGIKFTTTIQKPGEFIIKYPKTYSFNFSMGLNFSEEVNFASHTWLSHALEGEKWLSKQAILPNFSTFKLIVNLIQLYDSGKPIGYNSEVYDKVNSLYEEMYQQEIEWRSKVRKFKVSEVLVDEKSIGELDLVADDNFRNAFPSRIVLTSLETNQKMITTIEKFLEYMDDQVISLDEFSAELQMVYSDDKLKHFSKILKNYSIDYEKWILNYESMMGKNSGLSLKVYKSLLSEGERIFSAVSSADFLLNSPLSDTEDEKVIKLNTFTNYIDNLRKFLNHSNKFVEDCQSVLAIKYQQRIRNGSEYQSTNGLSLLMSLIDRIPTLNFAAVEVDQIVEFKNEIENFDKAARILLSKKSKSLKEFNDLINLGESFGIEIPSLNFLIRIRDRLQWIETYNLIEKGTDPYSDSKDVFTISDLRNFYSQGYNILSSNDLPMIENVDKILKDSVLFDMAISEFLRVDDYFQLDLEHLNEIFDKFRLEKLFINVENYNEISKIHVGLHLIKQYKTLMSTKYERISYQDAKHLQNSLSESGLKLDLVALNEELTNTENWVSSLLELAKRSKIVTTMNKEQKTPDNLSSKLTICPELIRKLQVVLYKAEYNFSADDQYSISSSFLAKFDKETKKEDIENTAEGADETEHVEQKSPKYYCTCREFEFGTMIECDKCNEWYHLHCVKPESQGAEEEDDENYSCPVCNLMESSSRTDKFTIDQVTLAQFKNFYEESEKLKIYAPNELEMLQNVIHKHEKYSHDFKQQIDDIKRSTNPIALKLDMVKFFFRKIYGNGILLTELYEQGIDLIREYERDDCLSIMRALNEESKISETQKVAEESSHGSIKDVENSKVQNGVYESTDDARDDKEVASETRVPPELSSSEPKTASPLDSVTNSVEDLPTQVERNGNASPVIVPAEGSQFILGSSEELTKAAELTSRANSSEPKALSEESSVPSNHAIAKMVSVGFATPPIVADDVGSKISLPEIAPTSNSVLEVEASSDIFPDGAASPQSTISVSAERIPSNSQENNGSKSDFEVTEVLVPVELTSDTAPELAKVEAASATEQYGIAVNKKSDHTTTVSTPKDQTSVSISQDEVLVHTPEHPDVLAKATLASTLEANLVQAAQEETIGQESSTFTPPSKESPVVAPEVKTSMQEPSAHSELEDPADHSPKPTIEAVLPVVQETISSTRTIETLTPENAKEASPASNAFIESVENLHPIGDEESQGTL